MSTFSPINGLLTSTPEGHFTTELSQVRSALLQTVSDYALRSRFTKRKYTGVFVFRDFDSNVVSYFVVIDGKAVAIHALSSKNHYPNEDDFGKEMHRLEEAYLHVFDKYGKMRPRRIWIGYDEKNFRDVNFLDHTPRDSTKNLPDPFKTIQQFKDDAQAGVFGSPLYSTKFMTKEKS